MPAGVVHGLLTRARDADARRRRQVVSVRSSFLCGASCAYRRATSAAPSRTWKPRLPSGRRRETPRSSLSKTCTAQTGDADALSALNDRVKRRTTASARDEYGAPSWSFALPAALCATWTVLAGKDVNWDLLNYHYYVPYQLLAGRLEQDFFAASAQSYLNPVGYLPFYLMVVIRLAQRARLDRARARAQPQHRAALPARVETIRAPAGPGPDRLLDGWRLRSAPPRRCTG